MLTFSIKLKITPRRFCKLELLLHLVVPTRVCCWLPSNVFVPHDRLRHFLLTSDWREGARPQTVQQHLAAGRESCGDNSRLSTHGWNQVNSYINQKLPGETLTLLENGLIIFALFGTRLKLRLDIFARDKTTPQNELRSPVKEPSKIQTSI